MEVAGNGYAFLSVLERESGVPARMEFMIINWLGYIFFNPSKKKKN